MLYSFYFNSFKNYVIFFLLIGLFISIHYLFCSFGVITISFSFFFLLYFSTTSQIWHLSLFFMSFALVVFDICSLTRWSFRQGGFKNHSILIVIVDSVAHGGQKHFEYLIFKIYYLGFKMFFFASFPFRIRDVLHLSSTF